jgi:FkbM family methyltransferase
MRNDGGSETPLSSSSFRFAPSKRFRFVATYVSTKLFSIWWEVKAPRLRLFTYEMVYSFCRATRRPPLQLRLLQFKQVTTIFGTFKIRPGSTDAACVSPAFERPDLNHLLELLSARLSSGLSVLFLDVGADIGTYAVSVGNRLKGHGDIRILAFEPSKSSYGLLRENLVANELMGIVEPRNVGLSDGSASVATLRFDPHEPGGSGLNYSVVYGEHSEEIQLSTIDAEVDLSSLADVVALKLDVEGSEVSVLEGASAVLSAAKEVVLLVEDFCDTRVINYLEDSGWSFAEKLTPYNSFWRLSQPVRSGIAQG